MHPQRLVGTLLACILGAVGAAQAGTIHVPGGQPDLAQAIAVAADGDTILLADGTYAGPGNRGLDLGGKALTIRSSNGPAACVIDCEFQDRAFLMTSGEGRDTVLAGLTITRARYTLGFQPPGEALYLVGTSPLVTGCVFTQCGFEYTGPDWGPYGGVAYALGGAPRFEDCRFEDNHGEYGGAVYAEGAAIELVRCTFRDNRGWAHITCGLCTGTFVEGKGGALMLGGCQGALVSDCLFDGNVSYLTSGAVGFSAWSGQPASGTIASSTFVGNRAFTQFGDVYPGEVIDFSATSGSPLEALVTHCVAWGNPIELAPISAVGDATVFVRHSDVQGDWPGEAILDVDPQFVDAAAHDFALLPSSPCVDAGSTGYTAPGGQSDLAGRSRLLDGDLDGKLRVDLGAFETAHVSAQLFGGTMPGSSGRLLIDGTIGLTWGVLLGLPAAGPTPLVPKLGYPLVDLPLGFLPLFGPGALPAAVAFSIPPDAPTGITLALLPVAVTQPFHAGNFGAPAWLTIH